MKSIFPTLVTIIFVILAFMVYLTPDQAHHAYAIITTTTNTVIGWNVPNGTTLGNGIVAFIIPIIVAGIFVGIPVGLGLRGTPVTFMTKLSILIGCLVSMLSLNASSSNAMPIALPIVAGVFFISYLWKGV